MFSDTVKPAPTPTLNHVWQSYKKKVKQGGVNAYIKGKIKMFWLVLLEKNLVMILHQNSPYVCDSTS